MRRLFILIAGLLVASCGKRYCAVNVCEHNGLCIADSCSCVTGYEGNLCAYAWNAKFSKTWVASELILDTTNKRDSLLYPVTVSPDTSAQRFFISGPENGRIVIQATISSATKFTIPAQANFDSSIVIIAGQGSYDSLSRSVQLSYVFRRGQLRYNSAAVWK